MRSGLGPLSVGYKRNRVTSNQVERSLENIKFNNRAISISYIFVKKNLVYGLISDNQFQSKKYSAWALVDFIKDQLVDPLQLKLLLKNGKLIRKISWRDGWLAGCRDGWIGE